MKHTILLNEKISKTAINYLKENNIEIKNGVSFDEEGLIKELEDCDGIIVRTIKVNKKIIENSPRLKLIAKHGSGLDSIDLNCAKEHNITVVDAKGANANSVAEHTIALMLMCARKINYVCNEYKNGNYFCKDNDDIFELKEKTLGLIGCGNVAKKVAYIAAKGFNMKTVSYDPFVKDLSDCEKITMENSIDELLKKSDIVSIHVPGTKENNNLINIEKLKLMKKSSILINTSRGNVVNHDDLLYAINNKMISCAGLDVTYPEPLNKESELFKCNNIIITPHCGAASKETIEKTGMIIAKKIIDYFNNI